MKAHVIVGPPGTGKTTRLLGIVERFLADGGDPERVGFVSFTKAAAVEARTRAAEQFGLKPASLPHFSTIHAAAYRQLGMARGDIVGWREYAEAAAEAGLAIQSALDDAGRPVDVIGAGDQALRIIGLAAAQCVTIREAWESAGQTAPPWPAVVEMSRALVAVKRRREMVEFSDLLRADLAPMPVDLMVIDEAQDLSRAQWAAVERMAATCPRVVVAGDDDQALYDWAGGDSAHMATIEGQREVLPLSYRLPSTLLAVALRQAARIVRRLPKHFNPRAPGGTIDTDMTLEHVELSRPGTWLLLHRHRVGLKRFEAMARAQGVAYVDRAGRSSLDTPSIRSAILYERLRKGLALTWREFTAMAPDVRGGAECSGRSSVTWADVTWPRALETRPDWMTALDLPADDREYLRALRRNGHSLTDAPRVRVSTIHGAKGAEADHVLLAPDVGRLPHEALSTGRDEEARVWYVALTRARESVTILRPEDWRFWTPPDTAKTA